MHKRLILNVISRAIFIVCFFLLIPLFWAVYDDVYSLETNAFVVTILLGILIGGVGRTIFSAGEKDFEKMNTKDALASVGLLWIFLSLWGALPLFLSGAVSSFTDAFFEIASGFTTTGASILTDIEALPRGILFWRSLTHWLGGMGVVVLYVALLPALGGNVYHLYKAETSGLSVDRAVPRLKENAKSLWLIYFFLSLLCFVLYLLGKMPVFDALCHTFGTIATGGFSTKNASIGFYGPYIQWVTTFFMFLGGINFLLYYRLFQGKPMALFKDEEFRTFSKIIIVASAFFAFILWQAKAAEAPIRDGFFQVVSILTATGYATRDFDLWPDVLKGLLLFFMFVGGCAGSTSGGLKIVRLLVTIKIGVKSVMKSIFPNTIIPVRLNHKPLAEKMELSILTYFSIFVLLIFTGTFFFLVSEPIDMTTAVSSTLSAISSVGPGLGKAGPAEHYAWMSIPGKWMFVFLMLAGRLEMYAILILFLPATWRK